MDDDLNEAIRTSELKHQIYANQSRIRHIEDSNDKDYQDFIRTLSNFSTLEDAAYENQMTDFLAKVQGDSGTDYLEVQKLINGLYILNQTQSEKEKENRNLKEKASLKHRNLHKGTI